MPQGETPKTPGVPLSLSPIQNPRFSKERNLWIVGELTDEGTRHYYFKTEDEALTFYREANGIKTR